MDTSRRAAPLAGIPSKHGNVSARIAPLSSAEARAAQPASETWVWLRAPPPPEDVVASSGSFTLRFYCGGALLHGDALAILDLS